MTEEIIPPVFDYWSGMALVTVVIVLTALLIYLFV